MRRTADGKHDAATFHGVSETARKGLDNGFRGTIQTEMPELYHELNGRETPEMPRGLNTEKTRFSMLINESTLRNATRLAVFAVAATISAQAQGLLWHQLSPGTYQVPKTMYQFYRSSASCVLGQDESLGVQMQSGVTEYLRTTKDFDGFFRDIYRWQFGLQPPVSDEGFVVNAYQCILFRDADGQSFSDSVAALKLGATRAQLVDMILASDEYKNGIRPKLLSLK